MTDWLSSILNFLIPPVVICVLLYWLWRMFQPMIKGVGGGEGGWLDKLKNRITGKEEERNKQVNVTYE